MCVWMSTTGIVAVREGGGDEGVGARGKRPSIGRDSSQEGDSNGGNVVNDVAFRPVSLCPVNYGCYFS